MEQAPASYFASFGDSELSASKASDRYVWAVTDSRTGAETAYGEAPDLAGAMIAAAQAVGAEWGAVRWRSPEDES